MEVATWQRPTSLSHLVVCLVPKAVDFLLTKVAELPPGSHVLEIGTFCGGSAALMASANPGVTVHTIDADDFAWMSRTADECAFVRYLETNHPQVNWCGSEVLRIRQRALAPLPNVRSYSGRSRAIGLDPRLRFSLCLIDGDHRTNEVIADFWHCWAMTKPGGTIIGDDFIFAPVREAVDVIERGLGFPVNRMEAINMFAVTRGPDPVF